MKPCIGVDEVGRGCLAGPVYAAAVLFVPQEDDDEFENYKDSKLISKSKREFLCSHIKSLYSVSVAWSSVEEVDQLNILQASLLAMKRAVLGLKVGSNISVMVDGRERIKDLEGFEQVCVIGGDRSVKAISMASIVAKVCRDDYLLELSQKYPHYGFDRHKGYGTQAHKKAIETWGPCPQHRKSFKGVKEFYFPR